MDLDLSNIDVASYMNGLSGGWVKEMGLAILTATQDEVTCEWEVADRHLQGYGIVHGGVHCGVIETLASIGAALIAHPRGQRVAGLENNTSFVRAVRSGRLHAAAKPLSRGRRSQLWEGWVWDERERLVAQGRVRLLCFEADTPLG
jgi:1,4-dihydroxy-2-naphthoyl-CoA hydrolase